MCAGLALCSTAIAQVEPLDITETDFNYVYSAVLGTGFYSTSTDRVFVLRVPLSWTLAEFDNNDSLQLLTPVTMGMRELVDDDGGFEVPNQLLTGSFLPGVAWRHHARDNWLVSPSVQAGAAQDFQQDTTAWMYTAAIRSYAWWDIGSHRLAMGNRLLGAGQHIQSSDQQQGFFMLDTGFDWNFQLPWSIGDKRLSTSVFVLWQHYMDDLDIPALSGESVGLDDLYHLGLTFGFREKITLWGFIPIRRIGFSIVRGNTTSGEQMKAVNLNLGFPLSYQ